MNKKQKKNLIRIIISAILMVALFFVPAKGLLKFFLYMLPYLIVGYDILIKAFKGIKNLQPLDECLLMVIATVGAIALALIGSGDYTEAVAVMLFYQIGEWFQSYAVGKSRKNISDLMDIRPDYANLKVYESDEPENESEKFSIDKVDPDDVEIGSVIIVKPGEKVPIDGVVIKGESSINTVALTGESKPRQVKENDEVLSGFININGVLEIKTTKEFDESTASKILELVEDASSRKSKSEDFISKFARVYTPVVVVLALLLAFVPPLILFILSKDVFLFDWIYRALTFLVISCPCALVISIPLSFFAGIGSASSKGVLIKGSNYLEALSKVDTMVFDKTGTLTRGVFEVSAIHPNTIAEKELLHLAAHVERYSSHPIAMSLKLAYENEDDGCEVTDVNEISGKGIIARVKEKKVYVGNEKLMKDIGVSFDKCGKCNHYIGTTIHVAIEKNGKPEYEGHIVISDVIKEDTKETISSLRKNGIKNIVILTGDEKRIGEAVAKEIGADKVYAELLPQDKVRIFEDILEGKNRDMDRVSDIDIDRDRNIDIDRDKDSDRNIDIDGDRDWNDSNNNRRNINNSKLNGLVAFVGDGINDAPVLTRADVGIAMGAMGSDAAIEAADVVLMDDNPSSILKAIKISKKTLRIVYENIYFAIGIKVLCLILGAFGIADMWLAIFADVGVMILAVLNAIRALRL